MLLHHLIDVGKLSAHSSSEIPFHSLFGRRLGHHFLENSTEDCASWVSAEQCRVFEKFYKFLHSLLNRDHYSLAAKFVSRSSWMNFEMNAEKIPDHAAANQDSINMLIQKLIEEKNVNGLCKRRWINFKSKWRFESRELRLRINQLFEHWKKKRKAYKNKYWRGFYQRLKAS